MWGCSVHTLRRLQQIAISCVRSCYNKLKTLIMSSTSFHSTATMKYWKKKKKTNATFGIDEKGWVQVALLQIRGGDGSKLWLLLGSLIGVSSVHFCLIVSVRYTSSSYISRAPQRVGILGPANFELRITIYWVSLEAIVNSIKILFDTSPPRIVGQEMLFLCLNLAVPSTTRWPLSDDVVRDWESIQSPLVKILAGFDFNQEMSTSAIDDSYKELTHSEHCTFGIVSHNSNNSTLPMSRIIAFDSSLNGL